MPNEFVTEGDASSLHALGAGTQLVVSRAHRGAYRICVYIMKGATS